MENNKFQLDIDDIKQRFSFTPRNDQFSQMDFQRSVNVSDFTDNNKTNLDNLIMKNQRQSIEYNEQSFKSMNKSMSFLENKCINNNDISLNNKVDQIQRQQDILSDQLQLQLQNQTKLFEQNQQISRKQKDLYNKFENLQIQIQKKIQNNQNLDSFKLQLQEINKEIQDNQIQLQIELKNNLRIIQQETKNQIKFEISALKFLQENPENLKTDIKQINQNFQNKYNQLKNEQITIYDQFQQQIENILIDYQNDKINQNQFKKSISQIQLQYSYLECDMMKVVQMIQEHQQYIQEINLDINQLKLYQN